MVHSRARQRGAAAVFGAITALLGLAAIGLTVDLARLYSAQRQLQRATNLAALDAARVAGGCLGMQEDPQATAEAEALASLLRNQGQRDWLRAGGVQIGRQVTGSDRLRRFEADGGARYNAVQVRLFAPSPRRLIPGFRNEGPAGQLTAVAAATSRPLVRFKIGSGLLALEDPSLLNALLGPLLGSDTPLGLTLLDYQALLGAEVTVGQLGLGIGPDSLDDTLQQILPVDGLLRALALALGDVGEQTAAAAAMALSQAADGTRALAPIDALGLTPGFEAPAAELLVNAGDLVSAIALTVADDLLQPITVALPAPLGDSEVVIDLIDIGQPVIVPAGTDATAGEDTFARSTQAALQFQFPLKVDGLPPVELPVFVQSAQATAELEEVACARRGQPFDVVTLGARSSIARIGIGRFDDINLPNPQPQPAVILDTDRTISITSPLGLEVPLPVRVVVRAAAFVDVGRATNETLVFPGPYDPETGLTKSIGTPSLTAVGDSLANIPASLDLDVEIELLGTPLPIVANLVDGVLATTEAAYRAALVPVLTSQLLSLVDAVVLPTTEALGLTLGGADVIVYEVSNGDPELFLR